MNENMILIALVLFPLAGALLSWLVGRKSEQGRNLVAELISIIEFAAFLALFVLFGKNGNGNNPLDFRCGGFGLGLHFTLDGFRALYCLIAAFMWMMTSLFSRQYFGHSQNKNRYYLFMLLTLGATVGVFLSADLYTTFIFFEIMSFTSYVWVAHDETKEALRAAETYLAVAVTGGLVMLMGLFLLYNLFGTLEIAELKTAAIALRASDWQNASDILGTAAVFANPMTQLYVAGGCLLFGFGAKAGAFPLHIWLPKAHPVAPAPASALLSGILTKSGIFGVIAITASLFLADIRWGMLILITGVATMVLGAVLAVFSVNLKRTLACSSVSQIGFILTGIGMMTLLGEENGLAASGSLLHMVNHSLIKLVLFMAAGAVYIGTHKLNLNKIRGFGRKKPVLKAVFLAGALGIAGVPGFNGYISKTLLHESIVEFGHLAGSPVWVSVVEWLFLISGGLTVAYMLKLYLAVFVEKNNDEAVQKAYDAQNDSFLDKRSLFALAGSAAVIPVLGLLPHFTMDVLAKMGEGFMGSAGVEETIAYFSLTNLKGAAISLVIGVLVYFAVVRPLLMKTEAGSRVYADRWPAWLDLENLVYRPVMCVILPVICGIICRIMDRLVDSIIVLLRKTVYRDSKLWHELEEGNQLTYTAGSFMDAFQMIFHNKTDYKHKFAMIHDDLSENSTIIGRSLSFGLFMTCVGLLLTLVYLLM